MNRDDALAVLGMAEFAAQALDHSDSEAWLEVLAAEDARLHGGLRWFLDAGEIEHALRLAIALFPYWRDRGQVGEGRAALAEALAAPGAEEPTPLRARALTCVGILAFRQGDADGSRTLQNEALDVAQRAGDRLGEASALLGLARVAFREGNHNEVRQHCEASLRIAEEVGNLEARALPLHLLAESARVQGEMGRARDLYEASLEVHRALEDERMVSLELHNVAYVDVADHALDVAATRFRESLRIARRRGDIGHVAYCVLGLGVVAAEAGAWERAAELVGKTDNLLERAGETLDPAEAGERDRVIMAACQAMGEAACREAQAAGAALSLAGALERALAELPRIAANPDE